MTKINNKATLTDDVMVTNVRNAIEHRATWMALIVDEAEKAGQDWETITRNAISRCGCFHGTLLSEQMQDQTSLKEFTSLFLHELGQKIFEMDIKELTDDKLAVEFHYCPLISAWQKQNISEETIEKLCDIAMDGDRGIGESMKHLQFRLGKTIAQGHPVCEINFYKK
ncbi:MAG: L-2-amino-thiazoline-4-carboxylic acid hydrolase [Firmicutes bacterium]|nr:L-2-amino-thiazoline-4-carboxylic acid hydrolase [Bacillota bacterium]